MLYTVDAEIKLQQLGYQYRDDPSASHQQLLRHRMTISALKALIGSQELKTECSPRSLLQGRVQDAYYVYIVKGESTSQSCILQYIQYVSAVACSIPTLLNDLQCVLDVGEDLLFGRLIVHCDHQHGALLDAPHVYSMVARRLQSHMYGAIVQRIHCYGSK